MTEVAIRPARTTDAGKVGAILSNFIDTTPWMPRIHTRAQDIGFAGMLIDRGWVRVAETPAGVLGFLAREGEMIQALYVADHARGQGVGSALLQDTCDQQKRLTLWTFQANTRAQNFYTTHAFREVERTDGSGNDEGLPDIRYEWHKKDKT
ncbi:MAG: GNAT family N-acetyltransferase [Paracoccaceae bacterium]